MFLTTHNNSLDQALNHAFDSLFSSNQSDYSSDLNKEYTMYEDGNNLILSFDLPGIKKEEISLEMKERVLCIQAKRKILIDEKAKVYSKGQEEYQINQQIRLPFGINEKKLEAKYENGVVTLILQKKEDEKSKKITLQ